MNKPRVIAFYLPQFHPTSNNDLWWGKGFTEWTNVGKAQPLFRGHYQPHVPADLGYYDLRLPEVREAQVQLAKEAGIEGFCYYHYWFGNGQRELERPFNEVLESGNPDFPFCLCWANESWHSKFWNMDGTIQKKTLVEQTYPGEEDINMHFNAVLPAFKDRRYIKIEGKPLFMIYKPFDYPEVSHFIAEWQSKAKMEGLSGIHFVAQLPGELNDESVQKIINLGFDSVNTVGLWDARKSVMPFIQRAFNKIFKVPSAHQYRDMFKYFVSEIDIYENVYPTLIPNWDHSPRSGRAGYILLNSTPELFRKHVIHVFSILKKKKNTNPIVFLKSWNEWGEGNYMEPDLKFGKGYINVIKEEIEKY